MGTLEDLKAVVLKSNVTMRGDVAYDFKNHTAVYEFKTEKGAQNAVRSLVKDGGKLLGKVVDKDGGVSIKAWDATNKTTYTLYVKPKIVQSKTAKSFIDQVKTLNDVKIDYAPPINVATGRVDFSEIDKAQGEIVAKQEAAVKADTAATVKVKVPSTTTVPRDSSAVVKSSVTTVMPSENGAGVEAKLSAEEKAQIALEKSMVESKSGLMRVTELTGIETVPLLNATFASMGLTFGGALLQKGFGRFKATAGLANKIGGFVQQTRAVTNLSYEFLNKITLGIPRIMSSPFRAAYDAVAQYGSATAKARHVRRLTKTGPELLTKFWNRITFKGTQNFVKTWYKTGLKTAASGAWTSLKTWGGGLFTNVARDASVANSKTVLANSWIGRNLSKVVSKIGANSVFVNSVTSTLSKYSVGRTLLATGAKAASFGRVIAGPAAIVGTVVDMLSNPVGNLVSKLTGSKAAGGATAGAMQGTGTALAALSAAAMVVPVAGWIFAAGVAACAAYGAYNGYKTSKAERSQPAASQHQVQANL